MKIDFDYRFDTKGFFNEPLRRANLEAAAQVWENLLQDDFPNIPAGIEFTILNPQTGVDTTVTLDSEIDDILIFVGVQSPPFGEDSNAIARGGFTGVDAQGTIFSNRLKSSDFQPWAGNISFDPSPSFKNGNPADWFFDETPENGDDIPINRSDFFTTALHEIAHVLGIGTASIFSELTEAGNFTGFNAVNLNSGNSVPLESDLVHIDLDFSLNNEANLMASSNSGRTFPSQLDLAILADIGYEIDGFTNIGESLPLATEAGEVIVGTILDDSINGLGGNDTLFGENNNDTLFGGDGNDQIQGGEADDLLSGGEGNDSLFGQQGRDRFIIGSEAGNDSINDFEVTDDLLQISPELNINSSEKLLNKITQEGTVIGGGVFSQFTLADNNIVTVFHDAPFTDENFVFETRDLPWDVNQDGKISPIDAIIAINSLGNDGNGGVDIDNNGTISALDAIAIISHFGDTV